MTPLPNNNYVFVNCPFDAGFKGMFNALVFSVYRCGFVPRSALEEDNALHNRLSKIEKIIKECKYGIHDISRTEVNEKGLPRFNMPFELGMFFGLKFNHNDQDIKIALVLEKQKHLFHEYISDLSGIDTTAHNNDPMLLIKIVRDWLKVSSGRKDIDGHLKIIKDYNYFNETLLPIAIHNLGLDIDNLTFRDYCEIVEETVKEFME